MFSLHSLFYSLFRLIVRFFTSAVFWLLVLVVGLSVLVWVAGPLFAFADYRPLESTSVRWKVIGGLFLLYLLWLLVKIWRHFGLGDRLLRRLGRAKDKLTTPSKGPEIRPELLTLQERFAQALGTMKTMRRDGVLRSILWQRKQIYELPWYVVLGAPGAGKTSALVNSGLDFPLAGQFGKTALQDVTATSSCDWWFADQAVLIDTAGRYVMQEGTEHDDALEWRGFLGLLKKHRPRQPVNGVILTLSASDLMSLSDERMAAQLNALRERLSELQQAFSFRIPVYVCITKLDLLAGFNEFFADFNKTQRDQVLGFTFPLAEEGGGQRRMTSAAFERLWAGVEKSLFGVQDGHLAREMEQRRRNYVYAFSQQFAGLRTRLMHAVEFIFAESKLIQQPMLRGVYFSSSTQQGVMLDRVFAGLGQHFAAAGAAPSLSPQEQGKSYFLRDLLTNVVFEESHLAGRNLRWEKRDRRLAWLGYGLSFLLLLGAIAAWTLSYGNNDRYLDSARAHAERLGKSLKTYDAQGGDLETLLTLLDDVKAMGDMPEFALTDPPLEYRYGLFQGGKVDGAIERAYARLLENGLQPIIARRIESQLRNPPVNNIEYLYESLKAYLMLHQTEHYSQEFMQQWVAADIKRFVLPDADPETLQRVDRHVNALFGKEYAIKAAQPVDENLLADARRRLSSLSTAQRAYVRLRDRLMHNDIAEFNMLDAAGPQAANVFVRRSGQPLNRGIPGLFTYHGYWSLFDKSVNSVIDEVGDDEGWVLGLPGKDVHSQVGDAMRGKLVREVRMLFLREYQQTWAQYLQDVQLIPSTSLTGSIQRMSVLSAPDSPLPHFLRAVVRETTLLREADRGQQSMMDRVTAKIKNTRDDIERVIGPMDFARSAKENRDERIVDDYFAPLRRLVGNPGSTNLGSQPIDALMKTLDEYYSTLMATDTAVRTGMAPPSSDVANRLRSEASRLPAPFGQMLGTIAATSTQQTSSIVRHQIGANLNATVGDFCRKAVEGRYPLNKSSSSDVTPQDFARLFGSNGLMQEFFDKNLASSVDASTWTLKRSADGGERAKDESLVAFQKANVIRNVFFAGGEALPRLKLDMKVVEMDTSIISIALDVDGTVLRYAHGPQISHTIVWPGARGRQEVSLQVVDNAGGQSAIKTDGAWALHRFFDKLVIAAGSKPETFTATATVNERKVIFEVTASSVQNPFRLTQLQSFRCPGQF